VLDGKALPVVEIRPLKGLLELKNAGKSDLTYNKEYQ
jgi:hypothetical protein